MTTYKEIFGKPIKVVSSDPTDAGTEGQIWYNSTLGSFRSVVAVGSWAAGGTLNTARDTYSGGSRNGTQNAFRTFSGYTSSNVANNETYNGTYFTEEADVNTARRGGGGAGTNDAALFFGGYTTTTVGNTEEWNGSSW